MTGACGTIGRAIAKAIAEEGANVLAHFHTSGTADSLCAELKASGVEAWPLRADFRDPGAAETLLAEALKRCACIDLLVNSASAFTESTLQKVTWADFQSALLVNAWAPFALGRAFSRYRGTGHCPSKGGKLLSISSTVELQEMMRRMRAIS